MPLAVAIWAHSRHRINLSLWSLAVLLGSLLGLLSALNLAPSYLSPLAMLLSFSLALLSLF